MIKYLLKYRVYFIDALCQLYNFNDLVFLLLTLEYRVVTVSLGP